MTQTCWMWRQTEEKQLLVTFGTACILHTAAPNEHPNLCPPEVKPRPMKTIYTCMLLSMIYLTLPQAGVANHQNVGISSNGYVVLIMRKKNLHLSTGQKPARSFLMPGSLPGSLMIFCLRETGSESMRLTTLSMYFWLPPKSPRTRPAFTISWP